MPLSYRFIRKSDDQVMTLNEIDAVCCELSGVKEDPDNYCLLYDCIVLLAIGMSMQKKTAEEIMGGDQKPLSQQTRKFLEDYTIEVWR